MAIKAMTKPADHTAPDVAILCRSSSCSTCFKGNETPSRAAP